jgi:exosortase family protein XrtM
MRATAYTASQRPAAERFGRHPAVFVLLFLAGFFALQSTYSHGRDAAFDRFFIHTLTVKPSVWLINAMTPDENVVAQAHRLVSPFAKLSVLNGCEGVEAAFLLLAAIMAFAAPWRLKVTGAALGIALVYALNQVRIVALYYAWRYDRDGFNTLHGVIGPTLIIIAACLFFLWWAHRARRNIDAQRALA